MYRTYVVPVLILVFGKIACLSVLGVFAVAHANAAQYLTRAEAWHVSGMLVLAGVVSGLVCAIVSHFDR